ncbi:MAG: acyl-CoA dehydrogenase N-terminal domain-containing protein [Pseudomonas sp.]
MSDFERELRFHLYELLGTQALLQRPRYAEHDRALHSMPPRRSLVWSMWR